jgi:hypothetical protein
MLEYLIEQKKAKMVPVIIEGRWREIDTVQVTFILMVLIV